MHALKAILVENERGLVVVGSAQYGGEQENPLTAAERVELIGEVFPNVEVVALDDIHDDDEWVNYVRRTLPEFKRIYTGSDRVRGLFEKDGGFEVKSVDFLDGVSGTVIREKVLNDEDYAKLVPGETLEFLGSINFKERCKNEN